MLDNRARKVPRGRGEKVGAIIAARKSLLRQMDVYTRNYGVVVAEHVSRGDGDAFPEAGIALTTRGDSVYLFLFFIFFCFTSSNIFRARSSIVWILLGNLLGGRRTHKLLQNLQR